MHNSMILFCAEPPLVCGCGFAFVLFIVGFFFPIAWYIGAFVSGEYSKHGSIGSVSTVGKSTRRSEFSSHITAHLYIKSHLRSLHAQPERATRLYSVRSGSLGGHNNRDNRRSDASRVSLYCGFVYCGFGDTIFTLVR